jgi:peptide/nickel transport system substrate-binding protein
MACSPPMGACGMMPVPPSTRNGSSMRVKTPSLRTAGTALVAAALSLTLVACGGSAPAGGAIAGNEVQFNQQPYENLRDGGTLTTAITEVNPQFNLWHGDSTADTRTVWNWYNPLLITFTVDGDAVFNPDYLSDVKQQTANGVTKVVYTINPKATYNDGSPIDWHSFETVWKANRGTDPAYIVSSTDGYDQIASVTRGADDRQAIVTFKGVDLWWQGLFNNLINPKVADANAFNKGYINTPHPEWGAGPYMINNFDRQTGTISFVRNPKWWGKPGKLDTRTFVTMEDVASINAFRNGQIDATGVSTQERLTQVQGMADIQMLRSTEAAVNFLTLNSRSPVLADVRVRKAVMAALDRKQVEQIRFQGLGIEAAAPGSMLILPFQDAYTDNFSKVLTFDPEAAKRGLDEAGWAPGPDGVRVKDGQRLEIALPNTGDDPTFKAVTSAMAAMLRAVGVQLNVQQVASSEFSSILAGNRFDMFLSGAVQSDPYGIAYICQMYCSASTFNRSGTNSKALDPEVQRVNTLPTQQEQFNAANDVETKAFQTYGLMPFLARPSIVATKKGLANVGGGRFFSTTPENIGWQK